MTESGWRARLGWVVVALAIAFAIFVRLRVAPVPIERDEGEYAYAGQLILKGIPPYSLAYNMKFPGVYYAYALILACFGQTPWGIHVGLLVVNVATIVLIFVIARRLMGHVGAAAAALTFAVLSLDRWLNGVFAHATHFVILAALCGLWLLLRAPESRRPRRTIFVAGVMFGLAVLMKQQAVFFVAFAAIAVLVRQTWRGLPSFGVGVALPIATVGILLAAQGVFGTFWFWTIDYARAYIAEAPLSDFWWNLNKGWVHVTRVSLPIWQVSALGLPAVWLLRTRLDTKLVLTGWLIVAFLAASPGQYFRAHYFILLVPSVALFMGALSAFIDRVGRRWLPAIAASVIALAPCVAVLVDYIHNERAYLFSVSPTRLSRQVYDFNPFIEAVDVARYIRSRTTPADRIAVIGSEPEIYFYAQRQSATGYLYLYPLMESQPYAAKMQREMIAEIERVSPAFLVRTTWSLGLTSESDRTILTWADRYVARCYDLVGVIDIPSLDETVQLWGDNVSGYHPRSEDLVYTYRRKTEAPCASDSSGR